MGVAEELIWSGIGGRDGKDIDQYGIGTDAGVFCDAPDNGLHTNREIGDEGYGIGWRINTVIGPGY